MAKRDIIVIAIALLIVLLGAALINRMDSRQDETETELVRDAVKNAALTCYAVEGVFPQDLSYLREHYGLLYDEDRYIVTFDAFAENLLPSVRVLEKGH